MKKLMMAMALMVGCSPAWAGISDIGKKLYDDTKVTLLESANVAYFYDLQNGNDKTSQGGVIDHVFTYQFLTADIGWRNTLEGGNGVGIGGIGIKLDTLCKMVIPTFVDYVDSIVPSSASSFWKASFVGLNTGWDTNNGKFVYAFHTGLSYKFQ